MTKLSCQVTVVRETDAPLGLDDQTIDALVTETLLAEGATGDWTIAVVLSTNARLRALHRNYMGLDWVTDILTFPLGEPAMPGGDEVVEAERGGDIVVSVEGAADQASDDGWDTATEVLFLVCHGVLHLVGWDDGDRARRAAMLERQRTLVRSFTAIREGARSPSHLP